LGDRVSDDAVAAKAARGQCEGHEHRGFGDDLGGNLGYGKVALDFEVQIDVGDVLSPWPVDRPADWIERVNLPLTAKELERVRASLEQGRPCGTDQWTSRMVKQLGLEQSVRHEGRPAKLGKGQRKNGRRKP
jgi:hypothetical protein